MKKLFFPILLSVLIFSCDTNTIPPGHSPDSGSAQGSRALNTVQVEKQQIIRTHAAVGTIRPLTQTRIESQVSGQVLKITVVPGARVTPGQVLAILDSRQLGARMDQAKEGRAYAQNALNQAKKARDEAKAGMDQARATYLRTQTLFDKEVVPSQKLEIDRAGYLQAKARFELSNEGIKAAHTNIRQAREVINEAQISLGYASIVSPAAGVVVERLMDPGDQAVPGKPLLIIQTSGSLRLEARIREGLIQKVIQGKAYGVEIQTLGYIVDATIEEIVPYADPETRTFLVKAALPETPGIYPGMFGRLLIPVKTEETLLIPQDAVIRVGHLEMVNTESQKNQAKNQTVQYRSVYIKTGKKFGQKIEVLSGLTGTEILGY